MKTLNDLLKKLSALIWKLELARWKCIYPKTIKGITITVLTILTISASMIGFAAITSVFPLFRPGSMMFVALLILMGVVAISPLMFFDTRGRIRSVLEKLDSIKTYRADELKNAYAKRNSFEKYPLEYIGFDKDGLSDLETDAKNALSVASLCPTDSPSYHHFKAQEDDLIVGIKEDVDWFLSVIAQVEAKVERTTKVAKALPKLISVWRAYKLENTALYEHNFSDASFPEEWIKKLLDYLLKCITQNDAMQHEPNVFIHTIDGDCEDFKSKNIFKVIDESHTFSEKELLKKESFNDGEFIIGLRNPFAEKVPAWLRNWPQE